MRARVLLGALLPGLVLAGGAAAQRGAAPAEHVVLISIDGLRPEFYLDDAWPAPRLQQMARSGARVRGVTPVFPSNTYPGHATMITGRPPAGHGIVQNAPFEPEGPTGRWYWEHDSLQVRGLWDAVKEVGGTSASFSWPVTVGAPVDWNVPEVWPPGDYQNRLEVIRRHSTPPGFLAELEREATGRLTAWDSAGATTRWEQTWWDERNADMAEYVLARYRPTLMAVHLVSADGAQHDHGRDSPELRRAVALADGVVSRLVESARRAGILERTAFVITGDHGFLEYDTVLAPNVWLVEAGLRTADWNWGESWKATFYGGGGSIFLRLADPGDKDALTAARRVLEGLPEAQRRRFRVVERAELDALGADPGAALALAAEPGSYFTSAAGGPAVREHEGAGHGFLPDVSPQLLTGLVAWGAGVRGGVEVERAELTDIASLVSALLGLASVGGDSTLARPFLAGR